MKYRVLPNDVLQFGEEWTDEELVLLAKAVKKYPGGTANRWEKIADMVGRSVTEVKYPYQFQHFLYGTSIDTITTIFFS